MAVPTRGDTYDKLRYHVVQAQDSAAMMAHLHGMEDNAKDQARAKQWIQVSELFKQIMAKLNKLAQSGLN